MKRIHIKLGTGLKIVQCKEEELKAELHRKSTFALEIPVPGTSFNYRCTVYVNQDRSEGQEEQRYRLVFDTRGENASFLAYLQGIVEVQIGPELMLCFHPAYIDLSPRDAALVVDIGNTRSFGLLLDGYRTQQLRVEKLRVSDYSDFSDKPAPDVFPSHICIETPPTSLVKGNNEGVPLSFVRCGEVAKRLMKQVGTFKDPLVDRCFYISPKRRFWDEDEVPFNWKSVSVELAKCLDNSGLVLECLEKKGYRPKNFPPSLLIGLFVWELIEQAEMQLHERDEIEERHEPSRIRDVVITYPPAWLHHEKESYCKIIKHVLDDICALRGLAPIRLHMDCDEATGTLLMYLANETNKKGSVEAWFQEAQEFGNGSVMIGVIDIGGGTSDLIVANVAYDQKRKTLTIQNCCQDGALIAGDDFLKDIVIDIVLPIVSEALCQDQGLRKTFFQELLCSSCGTNSELQNNRSLWAQEIWYPMALEIALAWSNDQKIPLTRLAKISGEIQKFSDYCVSIAPKFNIKGNELFSANRVGDRLSDAVPDQEYIYTLAEARFGDIGEGFADRLKEHGCSYVLLSGKTTEFGCVRRVLMEQMKSTNKVKVCNFDNYRLDKGIAQLSGNQGRSLSLKDVKMTTVIGAAIKFCREERIPGIAFDHLDNIEINNINPKVEDMGSQLGKGHLDSCLYWGLVPMTQVVPKFTNELAIFTPDKCEDAIVVLCSSSLFLARRRSSDKNGVAQVGYQLRLKKGYTLRNCKVEVTLRRTNISEIEIVEAVGEVEVDGVKIKVDRNKHLELRKHIAQTEDFWLVNGNFTDTEIDWNMVETRQNENREQVK